jgi:hypothetical protein
MHSASAEEESLTLVDDLVREITKALDSLAGKKHNGLFDNYRFWSSKHLHRAADGFAFLRRFGRMDASKFLVRPAIDLVFRLEAVKKHPDLLYRIAFSEHRQDERFLRSAAEQSKQPYNDAEGKEKWKRFSDAFTAEFPKIPKVDKELSVVCTAEKAGLKPIYDSHYRTYCQYAHGALRASIGGLDEATDPADNRTIALCAFFALDTLVSLGGESPNRDRLFQRLQRDG